MSVSMASALDAWLTESYLNCWTPPPGMPEGDVYVAQIKVVLNVDGSLSARPILINPPNDPAWKAHAESAMRAVKKCDPLHVPPQYAPFFDQWKIETIHFDPRETQG
jgi:colicin import membrane protein